MTDEEYKKLKERSLLEYIDKVSLYISSSGKKYKSHYATILTWRSEDLKKEKEKNKGFYETPDWEEAKEEVSKIEKIDIDEILDEEFKN